EILEGLQPATSGSVRVLGRTWDRDPEAIRNRIGVTLQETRFHEKLTVVGTLSGGQKQRLALAVGLVGDPELLFLDEPTTGLDPVSRRGLWTIIEGLTGRGRTVVLTTHYMEEAAVLCDDIVIVDHGRIVARGTPEALVHSLGGEHLVEFVASPAIPAEALERVPGLSGQRQRGETVSLSVQALHEAVP